MYTQRMGILKLEQGTGTKSPLSLRFALAFCGIVLYFLDFYNVRHSLGTI